MFCRKLFLPLLFAGLASLLAQGAVAQVPPWDLGGFDFSWGGPWGSTINCTPAGNATNKFDSTTFEQTAPVSCTVTEGMTALSGTCELKISYSAPGLTTCEPPIGNTSTRVAKAFCGTTTGTPGLEVSGTLTCNHQDPICTGIPANIPCQAQLGGITGLTDGQCSTVFGAELMTGLLERQVLSASVTSTGLTCTGAVVNTTDTVTRFCPSGSFNPEDSARCFTDTTPSFALSGTMSNFLPIEVDVTQGSINVTCEPNKDKGKVNFIVFGSDSVQVTQIASLRLGAIIDQDFEGVLASCERPKLLDADSFPDMRCSVPSCPDLGPILKGKSIHDETKTIEVTVRGSLISGMTVQGEDTVKTTP